jgi:hypothetical protein
MWHHAAMQIGHRSNVWLWSFKNIIDSFSSQEKFQKYSHRIL